MNFVFDVARVQCPTFEKYENSECICFCKKGALVNIATITKNRVSKRVSKNRVIHNF